MIRIGTSGYSYKDWRGTFYPDNIDKKEMLSYYAREFNFTEVNSTYYKMPNQYMIYNMMRKTPKNFTFVVKAFGGITHKRDNLKRDADIFLNSLIPLIEGKKLGCILAQFPYSFHKTPGNIEYLKRMREAFKDIPVAVEFRTAEWIDDKVFNLMERENLAFVCVDEPQIEGLLPPVAAATADIGYVRFHGRNAAKWYNHSEPYERYNYLYSKEELQEWVPKIRELAARTLMVFIAMNNHFNAQAVINARELLELIKTS